MENKLHQKESKDATARRQMWEDKQLAAHQCRTVEHPGRMAPAKHIQYSTEAALTKDTQYQKEETKIPDISILGLPNNRPIKGAAAQGKGPSNSESTKWMTSQIDLGLNRNRQFIAQKLTGDRTMKSQLRRKQHSWKER